MSRGFKDVYQREEEKEYSDEKVKSERKGCVVGRRRSTVTVTYTQLTLPTKRRGERGGVAVGGTNKILTQRMPCYMCQQALPQHSPYDRYPAPVYLCHHSRHNHLKPAYYYVLF